ncbi:MAG: hypothetical protein AB4911_00200 [Oscillochloridaceae bacterium umkhey_bin13]
MIAPTPLLAALLLPLLLYLPGWALSRRFGAPADPLERHFERVAASALWHGWLALGLSALGIFALWLHLALTLLVSLALAWRTRPLPPAATLPRWQSIAYAATLLVALVLVIRPFETILGVRDAGVYAASGLAIARTGDLVQADPFLATWGQDAASSDPAIAGPASQTITNYTISQPRDRYIATRLRAAGFLVNDGELIDGRVIPQGLHLLPAWIGLLAAIGGPFTGLFAPGLLGVLAVASVGMLGRRLAGPWVGVLAMALLALNGTQIWFGRYSTAETVAQFLIWAGLYFFARAFMARTASDPPERSALLLAATLAGVAIGQVAMARIDFFLLGPVLLFLVYTVVTRRWDTRHTALTLGMAAMLLHAGLHIALVARAYFFDTGHDRLYRDYALIALLSLPFLSPGVRATFLEHPRSALVRPVDLPGGIELGAWARLAAELGLVALALAGLLALWRWPAPWQWFETQVHARRTTLLNLLAAGIVLLGGYAYLIRPEILDADLLFNSRGGWNDPLTRDPELVAGDVREGRMTPDEARNQAGVVLQGSPFWRATADLAATAPLRDRLTAERGPWAGPFSNQTLNWLRLQGYVGAPIRLPVTLWYNEYASMSWWERRTVDPATFDSEPAPINAKYKIPLANLVRVGWYLSPLGIVLGILGFALWVRRDLNAASWLMLAVAFVGTVFYVRQTYGTSDQHYIYILRRFVPITYPAFSLMIAYALASLAGLIPGQRWALPHPWPLFARSAAGAMAALLLLFLGWTNRPIITHSEYVGAIDQLATLAARFEPTRDVLLMRGGAPIYAEARDVPDLVATPLRFIHGLDAFTVKSTRPSEYAADLAAAARRWQAQGRTIYLLLSASGANFVLPGFTLEPAGDFTLTVPEFEQLTDQKPRNVSILSLPFAIYRLVPDPNPAQIASAIPPLATANFAAQVNGLYRPEPRRDGSWFAWTNGEAVLRLPWPAETPVRTLTLDLAGGLRPAHLGPAEVCLSAQPETALWPAASGEPLTLGCYQLDEAANAVMITLDPGQLPPASSGSLLLRLDSRVWVPAAEDPRQADRRGVGIQFGGLDWR